MNNCQVKPWELVDNKLFPPECRLEHPEYVAQCELNAAADAWDLMDIRTLCYNDVDNKSSNIYFKVYMDRVPQFYFWNIIVVYYIIIVLKVVLIAYPYTKDRFDYSMALALTAVAFKFIANELVPKASYMTILDYYMLFGIFLLLLRFLTDMIMQLTMFDLLPFGEDGSRGKCTEVNRNSWGITPCQVDEYATLFLAILWTLTAGMHMITIFELRFHSTSAIL